MPLTCTQALFRIPCPILQHTLETLQTVSQESFASPVSGSTVLCSLLPSVWKLTGSCGLSSFKVVSGCKVNLCMLLFVLTGHFFCPCCVSWGHLCSFSWCLGWAGTSKMLVSCVWVLLSAGVLWLSSWLWCGLSMWCLALVSYGGRNILPQT